MVKVCRKVIVVTPCIYMQMHWRFCASDRSSRTRSPSSVIILFFSGTGVRQSGVVLSLRFDPAAQARLPSASSGPSACYLPNAKATRNPRQKRNDTVVVVSVAVAFSSGQLFGKWSRTFGQPQFSSDRRSFRGPGASVAWRTMVPVSALSFLSELQQAGDDVMRLWSQCRLRLQC